MRKFTHHISGPTEAEIQHAAYLLWIEDGRPEGRDLDHWLAAQKLFRHPHGRRGLHRRLHATSAPAAVVPANN